MKASISLVGIAVFVLATLDAAAASTPANRVLAYSDPTSQATQKPVEVNIEPPKLYSRTR
jgi:hypothetical protein